MTATVCTASPETRPDLLARVRDVADDVAWDEFVGVYGPLIHRWCRRGGLQDADASDVTQAVLLSVAKAMGDFRYARDKGRFRGWLSTITRHQMCNLVAASKRRHAELRAASSLDHLTAWTPETEKETWDREVAARRFRRAAQQARPHFRDRTWRAFWRSAVDGKHPAQLAHELGMSVGAVYVARCRVLARIKGIVAGTHGCAEGSARGRGGGRQESEEPETMDSLSGSERFAVSSR